MSTPEGFVEEHREEIEACAYQIWKIRAKYEQRDTPEDNFMRAIEIVKERYQIKGLNRL